MTMLLERKKEAQQAATTRDLTYTRDVFVRTECTSERIANFRQHRIPRHHGKTIPSETRILVP